MAYIKNGDRFRRLGVPMVLRTVAPTPSAVSTAYTFLMTFRETLSKLDATLADDMFLLTSCWARDVRLVMVEIG